MHLRQTARFSFEAYQPSRTAVNLLCSLKRNLFVNGSFKVIVEMFYG